jgi:hypothetical protein
MPETQNVPGRKTDVNDAQWLQKLHSFGLLRASFRPEHDISVLRSYLRQQERLTEYRAAHIQHMQKALMQMNAITSCCIGYHWRYRSFNRQSYHQW